MERVILGMMNNDKAVDELLINGICAGTTFGRTCKKPTNFKICLTGKWGEEIKLERKRGR